MCSRLGSDSLASQRKIFWWLACVRGFALKGDSLLLLLHTAWRRETEQPALPYHQTVVPSMWKPGWEPRTATAWPAACCEDLEMPLSTSQGLSLWKPLEIQLVGTSSLQALENRSDKRAQMACLRWGRLDDLSHFFSPRFLQLCDLSFEE